MRGALRLSLQLGQLRACLLPAAPVGFPQPSRLQTYPPLESSCNLATSPMKPLLAYNRCCAMPPRHTGRASCEVLVAYAITLTAWQRHR